MPAKSVDRDASAAVDGVGLWYHTMDLAPGVVTPGWFDLRPVMDLLPWPDVRGKRCLDIGTFDGHLAFELERRGAAEVVAADIASHDDWDWPAPLRAEGPAKMAEIAGTREQGVGFEVARRLLGSSAEQVTSSVYELSPESVGVFDVVVCGSLLLHLRDPIRAIEAIRSVCRGDFMSAEEIDLRLSLLRPRSPSLRLDGISPLFQWFIPNAAAHRRLLEAGGFGVTRWTRPYAVPFGMGHPARRGPRALLRKAGERILARGEGVPHQAVLASVL